MFSCWRPAARRRRVVAPRPARTRPAPPARRPRHPLSSRWTSGVTSSTGSPAACATGDDDLQEHRRRIRTTTSRRRRTSRSSTVPTLVVENGLDYDPWADKAVDALDARARGRERRRGRRPAQRRQSPHLVRPGLRVPRSRTRSPPQLKQLEPERRATSIAPRRAWQTSMRPYDAEIDRIKPACSRQDLRRDGGRVRLHGGRARPAERDAGGLPTRRRPTSRSRRRATCTRSSSPWPTAR